MTRHLSIFLTSLLLAGASVSSAVAGQYEYQYQRVIDTREPIELDLTYVTGRLTILASEDSRLVIDAVKRIDAVSEEEAEVAADHIEIRVSKEGKRIVAATHYLRMSNRSPSFWQKVLGRGTTESWGDVDFTLTVPEGCKISVRNTSGKVTASNVRADIAISTSSSDISLSSIEGAVTIDNAAGSTRGELLFGPVSVRQPMGTVDLSFVEGDIKVKGTSANVTIRQERGALDVVTSTGNVVIQTTLDSPRDCFVETETGNITLTIPETASGTLHATSKAGEIKTEVPIAIASMSKQKLVGNFGEGGAKVSLTSVSGDVTVARY